MNIDLRRAIARGQYNALFALHGPDVTETGVGIFHARPTVARRADSQTFNRRMKDSTVSKAWKKRRTGFPSLGKVLLLAGLLTIGRTCFAAATNNATQVDVAFDDQCERLLLREVPKTKKDMLVASYIITRPSIVDAICRVAEHKVTVRLKYDERQADYEGMKKALDKLRKAGVSCTAVKFRSNYAQMHDKFIVMDHQKVLTGSYNYTTTASKENYENLVFIDNAKIAGEFAQAFDQIRTKN